jgi:hypothetical protein
MRLNPFKKKPAPPSKAEVLRARPLRNPSVTWGPDNKGDMVIHIPLQRKRWADRFTRFMPFPETRHILLDDIGADVWEMCDGEHTIDAIRRQLTARYQMNPKEAEASLIAHLQQLARRKLIVALADPQETGRDGSGASDGAPSPAPSSAPAGTRSAPKKKKKR